jgi:hypothetical protein
MEGWGGGLTKIMTECKEITVELRENLDTGYLSLVFYTILRI